MTRGEALDDDVAVFLARARDGADAEAVGEVAIDAARELAPHQLHTLYRAVAALKDAERVEWFRVKAKLWHVLLRPGQPVYDNIALSTHARLFASIAAPPGAKLLLILFGGVNGEVFMPSVQFLRRLPPGRCDLLRLRAAEGVDFQSGVPGLGDSLAATCRVIGDLLAGYAGGAALGGSLGGFAALRAAVLLGLDAGIALSGRFNELHRLAGASVGAAFDPMCGCMAPRATLLTAFAGADHALDLRHAAMLSAMHPAVRVVRVEGAHDHNIAAQMVADGSFNALLDDILGLVARRA